MSPDLMHRRRWWTLVVLSLSLLVIGLDNTILNVALPSLREDLHASTGELQWIVDAYMLVFAGLLLTAGSLGDRFGRRRALTAGLVVFGTGSALAALASGSGQLIASRALMGAGGALIMPSTLSILIHVFPERERAKAIAAWAAVAGLGIAVGPVAGGWLLEHGDWNLVFLVNLPFVAAALLAGRRLVPESRDPGQSSLDPVGALLSTAGLSALLYAIIDAPARGWTDGVVLAAFAAAVAALAAFVAWERRARSPMVDLALFANPRFSAASGAIALLFFALFGLLFVLTQYLQSVLGYTALEAGVRTMPVAGGLVLAGPLAPRLTERLGTKAVVAGGMLLVAAGLLWLSTAQVDSGFALIAAAEVTIALGVGLAMAPATDSIMGAVPADRASVGSAVNDANRLVGGALGVAILGSLLASAYRGDMDGATHALPTAAADVAGDSVGGAGAVAARLGGAAGRALHDAASVAYVDAMQIALLVAAGIAAAGAVLAVALLPSRDAGRAREGAGDTPAAPASPRAAREPAAA